MTWPCFWVEPTGKPGPDRRWSRPGQDDGWTDCTLPPGAMLDATWWHDVPSWVGADGIALMVVLPPEHHRSDNGEVDNRGNWWHVEGPSRGADGHLNGPGWARTGDPRNPPTLSVTPSINTCDYHGHLMAGVLGPDLGGHVPRTEEP